MSLVGGQLPQWSAPCRARSRRRQAASSCRLQLAQQLPSDRRTATSHRSAMPVRVIAGTSDLPSPITGRSGATSVRLWRLDEASIHPRARGYGFLRRFEPASARAVERALFGIAEQAAIWLSVGLADAQNQ